MGGWVSSPDESSSSRADNQLLFCIHVQMQFNINGALTPWGPAAPGWGRGGGGRLPCKKDGVLIIPFRG